MEIPNTRGMFLILDILSDCNGPPSALIHILDDDSLLIIFSLFRLLILDQSESESTDDGTSDERGWNRERWWYALVHVCRRWRYLVLESASHLRLSLVCARGTPVAAMLANSTPIPLIINHADQFYSIAEGDEQGIMLALQHRDRVRRIRLRNPISRLQKFIMALDGEFPILEYLSIQNQSYSIIPRTHRTSLNIPESFRAPHLRHLALIDFDIPIESPLNMSMGNLVTLYLGVIPPSTYFRPDALFQRISLMPHLKVLRIFFSPHFPSDEIEGQLLRVPIMRHVALPNLRCFGFKGASAYLEALLPWVLLPLLEKLEVYFLNQLTYSIPHLRRYVSTAENFRPIAATLVFHTSNLKILAYPHRGARAYTLSIALDGMHLDWQVASAAQIFHAVGAVFSTVEHLTLQYERYFVSRRWNDKAHRTQWRELLRAFRNVKTIFIHDRLIEQLSHSLQPVEGESPTELLPELQELSYHSIYASYNAFAQFIYARKIAGRPVTVITVPVVGLR